MIWDWLRRRPLLIDSVLTAALLAGYIGAAVHHHHDVALGVVLALAQAGTVLARRFYPVLVLAVVVAATIGWVFVFGDWVPIAPALASTPLRRTGRGGSPCAQRPRPSSRSPDPFCGSTTTCCLPHRG